MTSQERYALIAETARRTRGPAAGLALKRFPWAVHHKAELELEAQLAVVEAFDDWQPERGPFWRFALYRAVSKCLRYVVQNAPSTSGRGSRARVDADACAEPLDVVLEVPGLARQADEVAEARLLAARAYPHLVAAARGARTKNSRFDRTERNVQAFLAVHFGGAHRTELAEAEGVSQVSIWKAVERVEAVFQAWAAEVRAELSAA